MREDITIGATFPDYELPDQSGKRRKPPGGPLSYVTNGFDGTLIYFEDDGGDGAPVVLHGGFLDGVADVRESSDRWRSIIAVLEGQTGRVALGPNPRRRVGSYVARGRVGPVGIKLLVT